MESKAITHSLETRGDRFNSLRQKDLFYMYITELSPSIATTTCNCDRAPVLVDPMLLKYLQSGVHCKVQLVSNALELDNWGVTAPADCPVINILALDDKREAVEVIVASMPEFRGYQVIDYWRLVEADCPF